MKWFQQGPRDGPDGDRSADDEDAGALFLPGAMADASLGQGEGFVLLGGTDTAGSGTVEVTTNEGRHYLMLGNRRYLADVPDLLPKDDQEYKRLDLEHYALRTALRGNFAAPIDQPTTILDLGCGTGRWVAEMASSFPAAIVIGQDILSPADRLRAIGAHQPVNLHFVAANVFETLPFSAASVAFVHMRQLAMAIPAGRWLPLIGEIVRVVCPGGWIELVEWGLAQDGGTAMRVLNTWVGEVAERRGIDLTRCAKLGDLLHAARLREVVVRSVALPLGAYGGRVGQMLAADTFGMLESLRALITAQQITTSREFDQALQAARIEVDRPVSQCIRPIHIAYGMLG